MSGIAGIVDEIHQINNQRILFEKMLDTMKHRGPIEKGLYLDKHVALMHTRLPIVDIENGQQPLNIQNHIIVYNGQCTNIIELKSIMINEGIEFHTNADVEVILTSYIMYK